MSSSGVDIDGFRAFESAGWATRAEAYHRFFHPVSEQLVTALLDAAQIGHGTRLLEGAGLRDVTIQSVSFTHTLPDVETYWNGMLQGTVRTAALVNSQPAAVQQRIPAEVERLLAPYATDAGLAVPVAAKLAVGRRSA